MLDKPFYVRMACYECCILQELKPIMLMLLSQSATGGVSVLCKFAVADGMKIKILVLYRLVLATAFITPLALIFERNKRPKFTWRIALQGFLSGLLGSALTTNLYGESLKLTSATYAAAMSNLIPAVTLVMAIVFRLESLDIRTSAGKAKILGTVVSIGGAMILTFFKGIKIKIWSIHINLLHQEGVTLPTNQVLGSLLALLSCFTYASWLIVQAKISHRYPCYSSTALMCFMGSIQVGIYALWTEATDWASWKLAWNVRLLTVTYTGIVSSGIAVVVTAWCTMTKGPLFVSSFTPLAPVFVAIIGSLCLDEMLHLGSIIGSILIIFGLYIVLWGKGQEAKEDQAVASESKSAVGYPTFHIQISDHQVNGESSTNEV